MLGICEAGATACCIYQQGFMLSWGYSVWLGNSYPRLDKKYKSRAWPRLVWAGVRAEVAIIKRRYILSPESGCDAVASKRRCSWPAGGRSVWWAFAFCEAAQGTSLDAWIYTLRAEEIRIPSLDVSFFGIERRLVYTICSRVLSER